MVGIFWCGSLRGVARFLVNYVIRLTVIDKDQPIKSLVSMSRDKILEAFDMYIKRCKSLIFGRASCDIFNTLDDIRIEIGTIGRHGS